MTRHIKVVGLLSTAVLAVAVLVFGGYALFAADPPVTLEEESVFVSPDLYQLPGVTEGEGTSFSVADSDYLNVSLESSMPVKARLESVPSIITLLLEGLDGAPSTTLTFSGLEPLQTYYLYQDDYHNVSTIQADISGVYTYTQDLRLPHFIFILTQPGTIFISDDATGGDCASVGIWNPGTKTCTLTTDLTDTVQIDSDGITLDGNGHSLTIGGVFLFRRRDVTIENLTISQTSTGITTVFSGDITIQDSTISDISSSGFFAQRPPRGTSFTVARTNFLNSRTGMIISDADVGSTITDSTFQSLDGIGVFLQRSKRTTMRRNTITASSTGFRVDGGNTAQFDHDIDTSNVVNGKPIVYIRGAVGQTFGASSNAAIFFCVSCIDVTVEDLELANVDSGVTFVNTRQSAIRNVTVEGNQGSGIRLLFSDDNTITENVLVPKPALRFPSFGGIHLIRSNRNTVESNTVGGGQTAVGIFVQDSHLNIILDNLLSGPTRQGIVLRNSNNNEVFFNTVDGSTTPGLQLGFSFDNIIFNNNVIVSTGIAVSADRVTGTVFNLASPIGGNFWSDYDTPAEGCFDANTDGFCDDPYVFFRDGQDDLPWTVQDGWNASIDVTLQWERNEDPDFDAYLVFRDTESGVDETDLLVAEISDQAQTEFIDEGVDSQQTFFYKVFVSDRAGLLSRNNDEVSTDN